MNTNHNGMLNWIDDTPTGHREIFLKQLNLLPKDKAIKILEIGCFVGRSIIEILNIFPLASATVIDNWGLCQDEIDICKKNTKNFQDPYQTFLTNIKENKMEERIQIIRNDSVHGLRSLIHQNRKFDLIYVDGSHKCLDCYSDLILSFELLNIGGMMIIDDFWFALDKEPLEKPYHAIVEFLDKYIDYYKITEISYRVFLVKTQN